MFPQYKPTGNDGDQVYQFENGKRTIHIFFIERRRRFSPTKYASIKQSVNQSISQSVNQSINQSINQSTNQSINQYLYSAQLLNYQEIELQNYSLDNKWLQLPKQSQQGCIRAYN